MGQTCYRQAPTLKAKGDLIPGYNPKQGLKRGEYSMAPHLLWKTINEKVPNKQGAARQLLLFLAIQNTTGHFSVTQKFVMDFFQITKAVYYNARKFLIEARLLEYNPKENELIVNFTNLYLPKKEYEELLKQPLAAEEEWEDWDMNL